MLSVEPQSVSSDIPGCGQGWFSGWYTLVHVSTHGLDRSGRYCGEVTQRYSWGVGRAAGDGKVLPLSSILDRHRAGWLLGWLRAGAHSAMTEVERGREGGGGGQMWTIKGKNIGSAPCWDDDRRPAKVLKHVQSRQWCSRDAGVGPGHFLPQRKIGTAAPCML